ncbi:MAG: GNAT family N-acetyltransferase [Nocardioidaceae bacterium]|nr:GNAT family N-acetyltransferase [Nocardioidaceae bacterium]
MLRLDYVGQRVVVRRVVPGERGPSGGPAMTDVLGILETWDDVELSVRRADGHVFRIAHADIVTAKPVPPRASVRQRIPAGDLERICSRGWQPTEQEELGDWVLRAAGGFTGRANSALVAGDPGLSTDAALERVARWYVDRELPVLAQVITDSDWLSELQSRGWVQARPDQSDALVQVGSVSQARRARRAVGVPDRSGVQDERGAPLLWATQLHEHPDLDWIKLYGRTAGVDIDAVRAVLTSGERVVFASIKVPSSDGETVAIGRGVVTGDWLGMAAVEVQPRLRRHGLGAAVVESLVEWGATCGALSAYLQTHSDNTAAMRMYERFGFRTHHTYRYLRPPMQ